MKSVKWNEAPGLSQSRGSDQIKSVLRSIHPESSSKAESLFSLCSVIISTGRKQALLCTAIDLCTAREHSHTLLPTLTLLSLTLC